MSERNELKRVLADFPIKKPFPLKRTAVELKPPTSVATQTLVATDTMVPVQTQVPAQTMVSADTTVALQTMVDVPTKVAPVTQVPTQTPIALQTMVPIETRVVEVTKVGVETMVHGATQGHRATTVSVQTLVAPTTKVAVAAKVECSQVTEDKPTDTARDQDSSVTLEAQAVSKLHQGYTRLPNSILMRLINGDLIRSEIQILLLIARFTISFQRRHAPLSKSVIERQTGLRGPAVLQAISDLIGKGLVEKIPGDQYRPNLLGLRFADQWDFFTNSIETSETNTRVALQTQVSAETKVAIPTTVVVATTAPVPVPTPAGVPVGTYFKDNKTIYKNNSLSMLPENLREYFSELKPAKKRESEWQAFWELQSDYAAEDIADCLAFVQKRGIGSTENPQPCHSPMAYLGKAIGEILREVEDSRKKARERTEREQRKVEAEHERCETEARETAEWAAKERAFAKVFPSEERQMEALVDGLRGLPFSPKSQAGRIMGIGKWWNSLNGYERAELSN